MDLLLGLDLGTSAVKGLLLDARSTPPGRVLAEASAPYPLHHPYPGWSEQDPADWWNASIAVLRAITAKCNPAHIRAVGLSGQMHGSVFLDHAALSAPDHPALRPVLLWNDQRTADECPRIESALGGRRALVQLVGNAALTGFTLPKILWLRAHEPHLYRRLARVLLPKDYLRLHLTGECFTDAGDASGTLLYDVERRGWSGRALAALDLDPEILPPAVESTSIAGRVTPRAAGLTGLVAGTPVAAGSGDNQCGAVGAGVVTPGMVLATLGTSGVIYAHTDRPRRDLPPDPTPTGRLHTMCAATGTAADPSGWCVTGVTLSAAGSLQWAKDALFPNDVFDTLLAEAARVPPGSEGLLFLPYLTGERCPHPDPHARGGWIGLTARHTRAHLVRAILEGVTYTMRRILDLARSAGVPVASVRIGGGGAKSALWRQLQADVYAMPVVTTNSDQGPAFGAALLAGVSVGIWPSVADACRATISETLTTPPSSAAAAYDAPRRIFERLYDDLKPATRALAALDETPA